MWLLATIATAPLRAQGDGALPSPPILEHETLRLADQETFLLVMGAAALSYGIAEFIARNDDIHFYQIHGGVFTSSAGTIFMQNAGIEKRPAPWFGLGLEFNLQQWANGANSGAGVGFNTYYRWHIFGRKKLHPFIEYGAGTFLGFRQLPEDGTNFTFHLTTSAGLEYRFANQNRFRLSYGTLHQSNNDLLSRNPGLDGNGFAFAYLWYWDS